MAEINKKVVGLAGWFAIRMIGLRIINNCLRHWRHDEGKANTCKIERKKLNLRTYIKRLQRKMICFSENEQIHDNVIGLYNDA